MKKILSSSLILATLALAFTGCLKDKGFDNHTYGINDPDTQPPGVGFPLGANAKNTVGLDAGIPTNQVINNIVWVNLEDGTPAKSDVHVVLVVNDALRTAYNTANSANIQNAAGFYNMSLTLTIPAGATGGSVPINVPSTVVMNPNNTYGIGLTISSVDGGYKIAENLKNLLVEITVKNRYDGVYSYVSGFVQRYTSPGVPICCDGLTGALLPGTPDVIMSTSGANSVSIPVAGQAGSWYWGGGAGALQVAGIDNFTITVDPNTNNTTCASGANGTLANWTGFPTGYTVAGYSGTYPSFPLGPPAVNKYDPATKTFHLSWRWNPTANVREYDVILKYKRPR
jgi:hypothetical protein